MKKKKKTHLKYRSFFGERYEKQRNWVWKMHAFRLVNIAAFTALVQLNNLYNNRFFNAYSMGYLSLTLCSIDTMVITYWTLNLRSLQLNQGIVPLDWTCVSKQLSRVAWHPVRISRLFPLFLHFKRLIIVVWYFHKKANVNLRLYIHFFL